LALVDPTQKISEAYHRNWDAAATVLASHRLRQISGEFFIFQQDSPRRTGRFRRSVAINFPPLLCQMLAGLKSSFQENLATNL